jgi:hypothetical protein
MMITRLTDLRQAVQYETAKVVTKKSEGEAGLLRYNISSHPIRH